METWGQTAESLIYAIQLLMPTIFCQLDTTELAFLTCFVLCFLLKRHSPQEEKTLVQPFLLVSDK